MVRGIINRRKTVARRTSDRWMKLRPGDLLWVKETWRPLIAHSCGMNTCDCGDVNVLYPADGSGLFFRDEEIPGDWEMPKAADRGNVSPLFLPLWASRIILEVTEKPRREFLSAITEPEAQAEGIQIPDVMYPDVPREAYSYVETFWLLWGRLHNKPGERREDNPEVTRVAFKVKSIKTIRKDSET